MLSIKLRQLHQLLFYSLILLLPTQLGKHFWPNFAFIDGIRIDYLAPTIYLTDVIIGLILFFWLITSFKRIRNQVPDKKLWVVAGCIYIITNILLAVNPWVAVLRWVKYIELGLLVLYVSREKLNLLQVKKLLVAGGVLSAVLALAQLANSGSLGGILYWLGERSFNLNTPGIATQMLFGREYLRPYATFPHPNVLAGYFVVTFPLLIKSSPLNKAYLKGLLAILWIVIIYLSGSAIALIVSLGILAYYIIIHYIKIGSLYEKIGLILGMVLFIFITIVQSPDAVRESISRRVELNGIAYELFKSSPIVGVGMNNYIVQMSSFGNINEPGFFFQPVHNIYLLVLAEGGAIGFVFFIWIVYRVLRISNPYRLSFVALLLLGLFDHYLLTLQQGQLLLALIIGLNFRYKKAPLFRL